MHRSTRSGSTGSGSTLRTARWVSIASTSGIDMRSATAARERSPSGPRSLVLMGPPGGAVARSWASPRCYAGRRPGDRGPIGASRWPRAILLPCEADDERAGRRRPVPAEGAGARGRRGQFRRRRRRGPDRPHLGHGAAAAGALGRRARPRAVPADRAPRRHRSGAGRHQLGGGQGRRRHAGRASVGPGPRRRGAHDHGGVPQPHRRLPHAPAGDRRGSPAAAARSTDTAGTVGPALRHHLRPAPLYPRSSRLAGAPAGQAPLRPGPRALRGRRMGPARERRRRGLLDGRRLHLGRRVRHGRARRGGHRAARGGRPPGGPARAPRPDRRQQRGHLPGPARRVLRPGPLLADDGQPRRRVPRRGPRRPPVPPPARHRDRRHRAAHPTRPR